MHFTLLGYPKTGKTTLFNILTGAHAETKAWEEGKKEAHVRTCPIPDDRLDKISFLYPEKKKILSAMDITDLGGMAYGEIKNSVYLSHMRRAEGLVHVVRGFKDPQIPHPRETINPKDDMAHLEGELLLADLASLEGRTEKLERDLKKTKDAEGEKELDLLNRLRPAVESGKAISEFPLTPGEEKLIRSFAFLSQKPLLHMVNVDENEIHLLESPEEMYPVRKTGVDILAFCGKIESEILELEEKEKEIFLAEYNIKEWSAPKFIKAAFHLLEMVSFFTIGKEEVRAWPVRKDTPAVFAAGAIHTDMEKGFIKAEVISWENLLHHGSLQAAKEKGAIRLEGKDYSVQDGDIITFRFTS